jgi:xylose isomerase
MMYMKNAEPGLDIRNTWRVLVFCVVTQCNMVEIYRRFGGTHYYLWGGRVSQANSLLSGVNSSALKLKEVRSSETSLTLLQDYTESHPRR